MTSQHPNTAPLPLEGIRVVSFSTAFAGPTASRYLADYGAEVIKVESLRRPDNTRSTAGGEREPSGASTSAHFQHFNRNKRGIAINLSEDRGLELMRDLLRITDVVTENFSGRVLKNWGFDYEGLRNIREDIILLDMQGLGQTGPWRDFISYGSNLHSYSSLTSVWGYSHSFIVDYMAAEHAVFSVLAALVHRDVTGEGTHIEFSQAESVTALLGTAFLDYFANGQVQRDIQNGSQQHSPHGCYRCQEADDWCVIAVTSDDEWRRFCQALDRQDWAASEDLASVNGRLDRAAELDREIEAWTSGRSSQVVENTLQTAGVPAASVRTRAAMTDDPHLRERGYLVNIDHPILGGHDYFGLPIHLSDTPGRIARHAPLLGQDNSYVFGELLGLSSDEVAALTAEGILA
jgi:crotonobetainyl-CoA:carnitine CoA-transferase CaiB-like acyl-CoA transferase